MTQEEKQLLLKDLSARLQYKPHCRVFKLNGDIKESDDVLYGVAGDNVMTLKSDKDECLMYYQIKPYLRPMSSMTREEEAYWYYHRHLVGDGIFAIGYDNPTCCIFECFEWLNSHHFDYGGLIIKGLALEAPEGMYNTKTE